MSEKQQGWLSNTIKVGESILIGDHTEVFLAEIKGAKRAIIGIKSPGNKIVRTKAPAALRDDTSIPDDCF